MFPQNIVLKTEKVNITQSLCSAPHPVHPHAAIWIWYYTFYTYAASY